MGFILGNGGPDINFSVAPGQTVRHGYWWDNYPLGNGAWIAAPLPPSIATDANAAFVVQNGIYPHTTPLTYYADVRGEDLKGTGAYGTYRLWIGQPS